MPRSGVIGTIAAKRRSSGPAAFPSRLRASGRTIVDANGANVGTLRGFNLHSIADFPQTHFDAIAALGGKLLRVICRWDDFEPTSGTVASGPLLGLDHTVSRAAAAGLYVMIDFHLITGGYPSWTSAQAAGEQKYSVYGQFLTQFFANRYGNPASPQYAVNVIGMGPNELPVDDNTTRNGNGSIPYLEAINRTWIGWMRAVAPNWIGFVCFGFAAQTPLIVSGETQVGYTEADATAYNSVGGNVVVDLHDYFMRDARTSAPYDGRQANGQLYPLSQGGPEYGTGDNAAYAPTALTAAQQLAYVKPYKDFCTTASFPLMIGEWGWPITTGSIVTAGEQLWIDDKQLAWADAGAVVSLQWNYDVTSNYTINPYSSRPNSHWRPSVSDEIGRTGGVVDSESFSTGPTGALSSRSGWSGITSFNGFQISSGGEVYTNTAESWALSSAVPATVEYEASALVKVSSTATSLIGVVVGIPNTSTRTGYLCSYATDGTVRLTKIVAGVVTQLASDNVGVITAGTTFRLTVSRSSQGIITGYIDGEYLFDASDTAITAKGSAGLYATTAVTTTTGMHATQFQVSNVMLDLP